ncbi:hypothetical protein L596_023915 [Steinernema carpocapsae]|uniref:Uncharacterized protein n=1 Tax=Steinernema carpocapsae TaxID=34508 RepID=A0A4U5MF62_STECR|nr:hypothetical protein L596_023915 [Steinernema carpocapsae]
MVGVFGGASYINGSDKCCCVGTLLALFMLFLVFLPEWCEEIARKKAMLEEDKREWRDKMERTILFDDTLRAVHELNSLDGVFLDVFNSKLADFASNGTFGSIEELAEHLMDHERSQKLIMIKRHITSRAETVKNELFESLTTNGTDDPFPIVEFLLKTLAYERGQSLEKLLVAYLKAPDILNSGHFKDKLRYFDEEVEKVRDLVNRDQMRIEKSWIDLKLNNTPGIALECLSQALNYDVLFAIYKTSFVDFREFSCKTFFQKKKRAILYSLASFIAVSFILLQLYLCHNRRKRQKQAKGATKIGAANPLLFCDFVRISNTNFGPGLLHQIPPSSISSTRPAPRIIVSSY